MASPTTAAMEIGRAGTSVWCSSSHYLPAMAAMASGDAQTSVWCSFSCSPSTAAAMANGNALTGVTTGKNVAAVRAFFAVCSLHGKEIVDVQRGGARQRMK